jgi:DHA1 family tetracycline resistance protein-like MFS transporter
MHAPKKKNPLWIIFVTLLLDALGIGILIPIIPQLLSNPASPYYLLPAGVSLEHGYILLGLLMAIFPLMQFFSTPILGQISDRFGRKPILAISNSGTSIAYVMFAIGIVLQNLPLLFVARAFAGISGGNIPVAQAAIADVTTPENRSKNFGLIGAAFGIGFVLGPYLGGKLSDPSVLSWFTAATPFWFAAILAGLNALSVFFLFDETHQHKRMVKVDLFRSVKNVVHAYTLKELRPILLPGFFFSLGFSFFVSFISVFFIGKFGWTQGTIGEYFGLIGICIIFTQAVVTRLLSRMFKEHQILRVTLFLQAFFIATNFFLGAPWQAFALVPFFAMANGLTFVNLGALVSRSATPAVQGEILGINASIQTLGQALPPVISGFVAATISPGAPIIIASLLIFLAWVLFAALYRPIHLTPAKVNV